MATEIAQDVDVAAPLHDCPPNDSGRICRWDLRTERAFNVFVFDPEKAPSLGQLTTMHVEDPVGGAPPRLEAEFSDPKRGPERVAAARLTGLRRWRVFAGQPDPADPTRMTIAYDVDGQRGVIDGNLTDGDRLILTPRVGRSTGWTDTRSYGWDLAAGATTATTTTAAATRPARP